MAMNIIDLLKDANNGLLSKIKIFYNLIIYSKKIVKNN